MKDGNFALDTAKTATLKDGRRVQIMYAYLSLPFQQKQESLLSFKTAWVFTNTEPKPQSAHSHLSSCISLCSTSIYRRDRCGLLLTSWGEYARQGSFGIPLASFSVCPCTPGSNHEATPEARGKRGGSCRLWIDAPFPLCRGGNRPAEFSGGVDALQPSSLSCLPSDI